MTFLCLSLKPGFYNQHRPRGTIPGRMGATDNQHPCEADPSWLGMQWNSRNPSDCRLMYIAPLLLTQTVLTMSPARSPTSQQWNRQLLCCVPTALNVTAIRVFTGRLKIALSPLNLHCSPWEGLSQQPSGTCSAGCWLQQADGGPGCSLELSLCCSTAAAAAARGD